MLQSYAMRVCSRNIPVLIATHKLASLTYCLYGYFSTQWWIEMARQTLDYSYCQEHNIRGGKESVLLRIAVCKHPLPSTEVNVVSTTSTGT